MIRLATTPGASRRAVAICRQAANNGAMVLLFERSDLGRLLYEKHQVVIITQGHVSLRFPFLAPISRTLFVMPKRTLVEFGNP